MNLDLHCLSTFELSQAIRSPCSTDRVIHDQLPSSHHLCHEHPLTPPGTEDAAEKSATPVMKVETGKEEMASRVQPPSATEKV
jgi:hypothetical protein